jgi:hypothetical protein
MLFAWLSVTHIRINRLRKAYSSTVKLFVPGHRKYQMKKKSRKEALVEKERRVRG